MSLAAIKCNWRSTMTDCPLDAVRNAARRAESSGRRYAVFSCGAGKYRIRRVKGSPASALEIVTPSWSYDAAYREGAA